LKANKGYQSMWLTLIL